MFKYEHYNSLILYSSLLLRCKKKKFKSQFWFIFDISTTSTLWNAHVCGCGHWKIDYVAQQPSYLQCLKKGGDWGKIQFMESVSSRCRKVLHPGSLWFPQLTVSCLPTNSTLSSFLQKKKKISAQKNDLLIKCDQTCSKLHQSRSKHEYLLRNVKTTGCKYALKTPPLKKDQTFR